MVYLHWGCVNGKMQVTATQAVLALTACVAKHLRLMYIGKACKQKCQQYCYAIYNSLLALATLGSATHIGSFLFQSHGQGK